MPHDPARPDRRLVQGVVLTALVFPTVVTLAYFVWPGGRPAWVQQAAFAIGKTLQFGLPAVFVWHWQRSNLKVRRPTLGQLALGLTAGMLILLVIVGTYGVWIKPTFPVSVAAAIREKLAGFGAQTLPRFISLALFYSVVHSLLEEYYWRWFVFGQLRRLAPWALACLVSSLGFTAHHVLVLGHYFGWRSPWTYLFSAGVALGGALWAWMYEKTGALWAPWVAHLLADAGIFLVGYDLVFR